MPWSVGSNVTAGTVLTASRYNQDVIANMTELAPFMTAWTTWDTTGKWKQGATSITHTISYARYLKVGRMVIGTCYLVATGTGSAGNDITIDVPVAAASAHADAMVVGNGEFIDTGTDNYLASVAMEGDVTLRLRRQSSGGLQSYIGSSPSINVASGDRIFMHFSYEAAS